MKKIELESKMNKMEANGFYPCEHTPAEIFDYLINRYEREGNYEIVFCHVKWQTDCFIVRVKQHTVGIITVNSDKEIRKLLKM